MKWICFIFLFLPLHAQANLVEKSLSAGISIIELQSEDNFKETIELYNLKVDYKSDSFGLLKKFNLGGNFTAGMGLLYGEDTIRVTTTESRYLILGESIDLNTILGAEMNIEFDPVVPIFTIGYQYLSPKEDFIFNINAGFRLLKTKKAKITFTEELGEFLESYPEYIDEYKREALDDLDDYYPYPVINISMTLVF